MARKKLEYVEAEDISEMAKALVEKYPSQIGHIDIEEDVYFAFCISKKPKNSTAVQTASVRKPLTQKVTTRPYQIAIFRDVWDGWDETQRGLQLLNAMYSISPEGDGLFRKEDVHDFYPFVAALGPQWQYLPSDMLPNPLEEKVPFPDPIAPNDEDEGTSITEQKEKMKKDPILKDIDAEEESKRQSLEARKERLMREEPVGEISEKF